MTVQTTLTKVRVKLRGLPPGLLFQGKDLMEAKAGGGKTGSQHFTPEEEARLHCHWTQNGKKKVPALPWTNLYKALCAAAAGYRFKGRKTWESIVASTVTCEQDMIPIQGEYEVYHDWVRIPPRTGAVVKIGRPRFREWEVTFVLIVDTELYAKGAEMLRPILVDAGKLIGIGAWRVSLKGPYGKFEVVEFVVL